MRTLSRLLERLKGGARHGARHGARMTVVPIADGDRVRIEGDAGTVAIVRPPPGVMLLEALGVVERDGSEALAASGYDLNERRGRVLLWPAAPDGGPRASAPRVLFEGPPESVLWRLAVRDGALLVRDTRHGVLYRIREGGDGADAVEWDEADGAGRGSRHGTPPVPSGGTRGDGVTP